MTSPVEIKPIRIGDPKIRSKITFEVVTARVIESGGKKHVAYTIIMKRQGIIKYAQFPVILLNFPLLFFTGGSPVSIKWLLWELQLFFHCFIM